LASYFSRRVIGDCGCGRLLAAGVEYGVFKKLNNVPLFFYSATIFLPLMAVGFAGVLTWSRSWSNGCGKIKGGDGDGSRRYPLAGFGMQSAAGAWGHFHTRIDMWTQQSVPTLRRMAFVNAHTTKDDFVIVPKQIYWLARCDRRSMLTFCARYKEWTTICRCRRTYRRNSTGSIVGWRGEVLVLEYASSSKRSLTDKPGSCQWALMRCIPSLTRRTGSDPASTQEKWPLVFHQAPIWCWQTRVCEGDEIAWRRTNEHWLLFRRTTRRRTSARSSSWCYPSRKSRSPGGR